MILKKNFCKNKKLYEGKMLAVKKKI